MDLMNLVIMHTADSNKLHGNKLRMITQYLICVYTCTQGRNKYPHNKSIETTPLRNFKAMCITYTMMISINRFMPGFH